MSGCAVHECDSGISTRGMCKRHYEQWRIHGRVLNGAKTRREPRTGEILPEGYVRFKARGIRTLAHVLVAEKALGKKLPRGAIVHHVNGDPTDNRTDNLVVCPDAAYHRLLHVREVARGKHGSPDVRVCVYCKKPDHIDELNSYRHKYWKHAKCVKARAA